MWDKTTCAFGQSSEKKTKALSKWADKRLGFKHELILTLVEDGFTYREAEDIIEVILASIKSSLLRREDVTIENYGSWQVREASPSRGYRFGKVVRFKKYKLQFRMEDGKRWAAVRSAKKSIAGRSQAPAPKQGKRDRRASPRRSVCLS